MLRQIIVRNFAYFRESQTLDFESGYYFMIGENDSGKSSLFEIIRGCMGPTKSICLTKPHDLAQASIAICFFRVCNKTDEVNLKDNDESEVKAHDDEDLGEGELVSALIRPCLKTQDEDEKKDIYLKLVHVRRNGGEKYEFKMAYLTATKSSGNDFVWKSVNQSCSESIRKELECEKEWRTKPNYILQTINKYLTPEKLRKDEDKTETAEFEMILKRYINKSTVVTFPLSGISPCQWTKSKRLKKNIWQNVEHNEAQEEIIAWYLKKLKKEPRAEISDDEKRDNTHGAGISDEERQEQKYFRLITNNSGYDFEYVNGKVTVTNKADKDTELSLQQIPEGIYGAKKLSVILAVKRFQTVCLEEPGRGMHPQMIERIRDRVLRQVQDKVILITSHNPSFLSQSTLERVFFFRREYQGQSRTSTIVPIMRNHDLDDKTGRLITTGLSTLLFFSNKVLLVEGDTDYIFVNALREVLLTTKDLEKYVKHSKTRKQQTSIAKTPQDPVIERGTAPSSTGTKYDNDTERVKTFLSSLQIIPMTGEANKFRYKDFCSHLGQHAVFLMDNDVLTRNIPGHDPKCTSPEGFLKGFGIKDEERVNKLCQEIEDGDVSVLEEDLLFIWKGTIETVTAALDDKHDIKKFCKENNVYLQPITQKAVGENTEASILVNTGTNTEKCTLVNTETDTEAITLVNTDTNTEPSKLVNTETNTEASTLVNTDTNTEAITLVNAETYTETSTQVNAETNTEAITLVNIETNTGTCTMVDTETNTETCTLVDTETNTEAITLVNTETNTEASTLVNTASNTEGSTLINTATNTESSTLVNAETNTEAGTLVKRKKPKTPKKLFSDKKLTTENIKNVVQKIVDVSVDDTDSEFHRLILFLVKQCEICHK